MAFAIRFVKGRQPGALRVVSDGCTALAGVCLPGSSSVAVATAQAQQVVALVPGLATAPGAPLTTREGVASAAALGLHNTDAASGGSVLHAGSAVSLPNARSGGRWALAGLVAAVAVVLLGAGWWLASGRARPRPVPAAPPALARLDAIAALDARYAGREAAVPPDEWRGYLEQRARLKGELEAALAAGGVGI